MKPIHLLPWCACLITALTMTRCDRPTAAPPEPLVLDAPNGGNTYYVGDTLEIRWTQNDSISGLEIDLTANNGTTYTQVAAFFANDPEIADGKYNWVICDSVGKLTKRYSVSDSCKIWAHDYFDYSIGDASDRVFSIKKR
jgi:hypothetical protein